MIKKSSELPDLFFGDQESWENWLAKNHDTSAGIKLHTPRSAKSIWSKVNKDKAELLIKYGKMKPSGLKAIETSKRTMG